MKITYKIGHMIKKRGMTQKQLADKLRLNLNYLRQIIYGQRDPPFPLVVRIAMVLECKLDDLFDAELEEGDED